VYPASVIAGAGSALLWVAEGHFITEVALADSPSVSRTGAPVRGVLGMYSGIFMGAFALTQVAGNALSSAVLLGCRNGPVSANYIMFALYVLRHSASYRGVFFRSVHLRHHLLLVSLQRHHAFRNH
jgi:hypothetical protein